MGIRSAMRHVLANPNPIEAHRFRTTGILTAVIKGRSRQPARKDKTEQPPPMKLTHQTVTDLMMLCLFVVASLILSYALTSESIWWKDSSVWIWFEFSALLFFLRPLFYFPESRLPMRDFFRELARTLGVLMLSVIPALAVLYWWLPQWNKNFIPEMSLWLMIPALVGCGSFTLGMMMRIISKRMGE